MSFHTVLFALWTIAVICVSRDHFSSAHIGAHLQYGWETWLDPRSDLERIPRATTTVARLSSSIPAFCRLMAVFLMASMILEASQLLLMEPVLHKLREKEGIVTSLKAFTSNDFTVSPARLFL
eukprot:6199455-Pleurochrysis_carterae.AAC.2